jgi:hypothetical protein
MNTFLFGRISFAECASNRNKPYGHEGIKKGTLASAFVGVSPKIKDR